ncbi:MAG: type IV pilin-like G/H family protein [Leptolyngbyaceae cyanobacterium MO_188.B28]|nr:type IV pilin-like G/H family protein [Leptolyngbyaceae cyanobacterium MO_188.B28]
MTENPPSPGDFTPDPNLAEAKKAKMPLVLWIASGLGCGCLGLFLLGIVAAILLPAFLNQANKARESEAKTYIGAVLRGQQAYFIEEGEFSATVEELNLGLRSETDLYRYELDPAEDGSRVIVYAKPKEMTTRGFVGAVYVVGDSPADASTVSGLCQSDDVGQVPPEPSALDVESETPKVICPPGSSAVD